MPQQATRERILKPAVSFFNLFNGTLRVHHKCGILSQNLLQQNLP